MTALDYLRDRADPRVSTALTRRCSICKAEPDDDCFNPWDMKPLNRVVHQCRAESHMDKKVSSRDE